MKRLLALALALCLCLSILPGAAWETTSGTIGESHVSWSVDETSGRLTISGSGGCETFESAEDQPWAALRTEIREVWFYDQADLAIENLAYWFTDCVNLTMAEVPYTTSVIGEGAFAGCSSLVRLMLYYSSGEDFTIDPGAFRVDEVVETAICYPSQNESVGLALAGYDWEAENRTVSWYDVYGAMPLLYCYEGGSAHQGDYFNKVWVDSCRYNIYCKWCGQYLNTQVSHTYVDGVCSKCGCEKRVAAAEAAPPAPIHPAVQLIHPTTKQSTNTKRSVTAAEIRSAPAKKPMWTTTRTTSVTGVPMR